MPELPLAAEFPPVSREEWLALVEKSLQGVPFDKKLVSKTYDGLRIEPLYKRAEHARAVAGRAPSVRWGVVQRLDHPDPAAANVEALHDLENGATGLAVLVAGAPSANGYGLRDASQQTLARALDNVWIDAVALRYAEAFPAGYRERFTPEDGALVVGGGLASIDVAKVLMLETTRAKLRERGIDVPLVELEVKGIPKILERHSIRFEELDVRQAALRCEVPSALDLLGTSFHSDDPASGTDALREQAEAASRAAADLDHSPPRTDADLIEQPL